MSSWGQLGAAAGLVVAPAILGLAGCSSSDCGGSRDCFTESEGPESSDGGQGGQSPEKADKVAQVDNAGGEAPTKPEPEEEKKPVVEKCVPEEMDVPDGDY